MVVQLCKNTHVLKSPRSSNSSLQLSLKRLIIEETLGLRRAKMVRVHLLDIFDIGSLQGTLGSFGVTLRYQFKILKILKMYILNLYSIPVCSRCLLKCNKRDVNRV